MPKQVLDNKSNPAHNNRSNKKTRKGKKKSERRKGIPSISITVISLLANNAFVSGAVKLRCSL